MKTMKCDLCDFEAQGETFEEWMSALKPHYAAAHADFMKERSVLPETQQKAEMEQWMTENERRFAATD